MSRDSVIVPKKLWHTTEKRYLTIKEMVEMEARFHWKCLYDDSFFKSLSIEVVENSSEEISGAVTELNDRIDGKWVGPDYPVADFLTKENVGHCSNAYISALFIQNNKDIFTD
jgi:putative glycosyltransferase (TIGR04372 family)